MKLTMKKKQIILFKRIYQILCLFLLILNIIFVTIDYKKYLTDTQAAYFVPKYILLPKISLCFSMNSLIKGQLDSKFIHDSLPVFLDKTVGELFHQLPEPDKVLAECSYRNFSTDSVVILNETNECLQIFTVKRYRMQTFVCYMMSADYILEYNLHLSLFSMDNPGLIFSFTINPPLNEGHNIFPLVHYDEMPNDDRMYNIELITSPEKNETYKLTFDWINIVRLPRPYETICGEMSRLSCICNCTNINYSKLGYIPVYSIATDDDIRSKSLRIPDFTNKTIGKTLYKIEKKCRKSCIAEACRQNLVKSIVSHPLPSPRKLLFEVGLRRLAYRVRYKVKMSLGDYLEKCLNLSGIWIELSIIIILLANKRTDLRLIRTKLNLLSEKSQRLFIKTKALLRQKSISINYDFSKNNSIIINENIRKRLFNLTVQLIIYGIFIWQISNVFFNYFAYKTKVKYEYTLNPRLYMPSLSLCLPIESFFNLNFNLDNTNEGDYDAHLEQDGIYKNDLSSLFNLTWNEEILYKCRFRNLSDSMGKLILYDREECLDKISILKFHLRRQICYDFQPKKFRYNIFQTDARFLTINMGTLYTLIINPQVRNFANLRLSVHFGYDLPDRSIEFAVISAKTDNPRMHQLSYLPRRVEILPPPYDTHCNPIEGKPACERKCLSEAIDKINRLPYGSILDQPKAVKVLTYVDLKNATINEYWRNLEEKCDRKCQYEICILQFTQTFIRNSLTKYEFDVEFIIDLPGNPPTRSIYSPRTTLYDLYYQTFSCFAFWLGFSITSYNPFKLIQNRYLRRLKNEIQLKFIKSSFLVNELKKLINQRKSKSNLLFVTMSTRNMRKSSIYFICILGCILHVRNTMIIYFGYHSILSMEPSLESRNDYDLVICLQYEQLFTNSHQMTIEEILQKTPKNTSLLNGCGYWGLHDKLINDLSHASDRVFFTEDHKDWCDSLYEVNKFVLPGFICYKVKGKKVKNWNRMQVLNSLSQFAPFSAVIVNTSFLTNTYTVTISPGNNNPLTSIFWTPWMMKRNINTWYSCSYIRFHSKLLPSPFSNEGYTTILFPICMANCINNLLIENEKVIGGSFDQPNDFKFIGPYDRKINEFNIEMNQYTNKCDTICSKRNSLNFKGDNLDSSFTYTNIFSGSEIPSDGENRTTFYLTSTNSPIIHVIYVPQMSLFELIIEIGSIISIWFGLSVIKMNPFRKRKVTICMIENIMNEVSSLERHFQLSRNFYVNKY